MTEKAKQLIIDFKNNGWQTPNLYERLFDLTTNSTDTFYFATEYLKSFDKNATIFNDILSYIDKFQFADLINSALEILKKQKNENAESVIEYASLQFPELLHNYLELIFELKPNERTYYADYPWRNLSSDRTQIFKEKLISSETNITDKQKLFRCLLETRNLETINFAYGYALTNKLFDNENLEDFLVAHLELVGFTKRNDNIENYCQSIVRHFSFNKNYFSDDRPIHINKKKHPTWNLKANETKYKFGGFLQDDDKNPFIHLVTFDKIPSGLKISGLSSLTLGMHIRELNECGAVFYQHDNFGKPSKIGETKEIDIYSDLPIKETEISLAETPNRWTFQSWGSSNSRENLFRLGGEPTWIQSAEVLVCPISNKKMDFLLQLDTDLPDIENGEVYFGSGGICYAFWCDKTKVSGYIMQCT
ncbi:MAG TPA: hypothetical protein VK175_03730 [Leadbetterella sp.]|nr:hypothetical protein [Leadbetterella sp.]